MERVKKVKNEEECDFTFYCFMNTIVFTHISVRKIIVFFLCLYLFLLPWQTVWVYQERFLNGDLWQYGTLKFYVSEVLLWSIVLLQVGFLFKRIAEKKVIQRFSWSKDRQFFAWLFVFLLYGYVGRFWAEDLMSAAHYSLYLFEAVLLFILILFLYKDHVRVFAKWFIYGSILPVLLGMGQFVSQFVPGNSFLGLAEHDPMVAGASIVASDSLGRMLRAYGSFSHPNVLGGYLVLVLGVLGYVWFSQKKNTVHPYGERLVLCGMSCLLGIGILLTFSRTAWLGVILLIGVGISFVGWKCFLKQCFVWCFVVSFFVTAALNRTVVQVRMFGGSIHETASVSERVEGYSVARELFVQYPMFGVGAGGYTAAMHELYPEYSGWEYQPVHNGIVLFFVEYGIVGVLLCGLVVLRFVQFYNIVVPQAHRWGVGILLVFPLVLSLFDHYWLSQYVGFIFLSVWYGLLLSVLSTFYPVFVHTE